MLVNIAQSHAGIGRLHNRIIIQKTENSFSGLIIIFRCKRTLFCNVFFCIFLLKAEDVGQNAGPKKFHHSYCSCCHWNANNLAKYYYSKVLEFHLQI